MLTVGEVSGYVIGHLNIDGKEAILERHIDTAKVNFSYDGKVYKKSSEVNELWQSLFQIDKNIVQNIIVSNQGEIALLFNGDNSVKEKLFQKIFMVPNTSKLRDVIWNNYIKDAPPEYPVKDITEIASNISCIEKSIDLAHLELENLVVDDSKYDDLVARRAYLIKVDASAAQRATLQQKLETAESRQAELSKSAEELKSKIQVISIQDYRNCLAEQKALKARYDTRKSWELKKVNLEKQVPKVSVDRDKVQALRQTVLELEAELKTKRAAVAEFNKKIDEYEKSGLASGTCPTCGTKVDNITKLIEHIEKERAPVVTAGKKQKEQLVLAQQQLKELETHLKEWEDYDKELLAINNALATYKDVSFNQEDYDLCAGVISKYENWEQRLTEITSNLNIANSDTHRVKLEIAGLATYDKDMSSFPAEKQEVEAGILAFQKLKEARKQLEIEVAANARELKSLSQELKDNELYKEKNKKRTEYVDVLKSLYDLFHTGKFPRALIQTYSSTVSEYMTDVLQGFDFPYTAKVNETFGIDIFNEEGLQLPAISGGQQVMVGFSLRLALHNMFVGAFPFMVIDEGSYGLNNENAKKYFEIIKSLGKSRKFKQVIVIDDHSELSEYVDNTINL